MIDPFYLQEADFSTSCFNRACGFDHPLEIARLIFQAGILDGHDISGGVPNTRSQRRALPLVDLMLKHGDFAVLRSHISGDREAVVRGGIIHDDDFQPERFILDCKGSLQAVPERAGLVVAGHDDGKPNAALPARIICGHPVPLARTFTGHGFARFRTWLQRKAAEKTAMP